MSPRIALVVLVAVVVGLASLESAPIKPGGGERHVNYVETVTQKVGPEVRKARFEMIAVPGGEFLMGSPADEDGRKPDEGPQVRVKLKPFWLGKCEVTWDEFDAYWTHSNLDITNPDTGLPFTPEEQAKRVKEPADAVTRPSKPYVDETYTHGREGYPAICMTHHLAMLYCEWLSKKTGKQYRLPTEAEWEYACRAGSTGPLATPAGVKLDDHAWYKANSPDKEHPRGTTHPVGTKRPNAWGLHDMHGNVMEWCLDHYLPDAYARFTQFPRTDGFLLRPCFKPTENKWSHVARGGHFKSDPKGLRSAARVGSDKSWIKHDPQDPQSIWWLTQMDTVGFRVCRSLGNDDLKGIVGRIPRENDATYKP
jgi:formylglycine-generating enzyme required for sulfatase activity